MIDYRLVRKQKGVKKLETVSEFSCCSLINDICHVGNGDMMAIIEHRLIKIQNNKVIDFAGGEKGNVQGGIEHCRFTNPSSIYFVENCQRLYIAQSGGRIISYIDLNENWSYEIVQSSFDKYFLKTDDTVDCSIWVSAYGNVYWSSPSTKRIYGCQGYETKIVAGNGRNGMSMFNEPQECSLSPKCITGISESQKLFISDSNGRCIYELTNGKLSILKDSMNIVSNIDKMICDNNNLWFMDGNKIKYWHRTGNMHMISEIYCSNCNICSFFINDKYVYVLETK